ncbi:MAG: hypothetical protein ACOH1T_03515 [Microbacteriaceae bacterium]
MMLAIAAGAIVVGTALSIGSVAFAATECDDDAIRAGTCGSSNDGDHVTIGIDDKGPGGPGNTGGGPGPGGGGGGGGGGGADPNGDDGECPIEYRGGCWSFTPPTGPADPVTLSDIAHFHPTPEIDHMQPTGWMIVGLDTNFYATGNITIVNGQLLGKPAAVRFTPIRWHWTYGDKTSASTQTRGAPWATLHAAEFDKTATSHVYTKAGTYFIDLTVDYRAEYKYDGSPWWPVQGTLTLPANRLVATASNADTVLVDKECTRNPRGPGC